MKFEKILSLNKNYAEKIQNMLDTDDCLSKENTFKVCDTLFINFPNDITVSIQLIGLDNEIFFINPLLLDHNSEVVALNARYQLLGEYVFEYNNNEYIVKINTLTSCCMKCIIN